MKKKKIPKLPSLFLRKIYKTGQTRGADDDEIYQNRVGRNSTVLIPISMFAIAGKPPDGEDKFENGYIVLISPDRYFGDKQTKEYMKKCGLVLGHNALIFYETRSQWSLYNPDESKWTPAKNRQSPLGGEFVARISATTADKNGKKITKGFETTKNKGAGIRVYEYASSKTIKLCVLQLEAIYWKCSDSEKVSQEFGMTIKDVQERRKIILEECQSLNLLDEKILKKNRILNSNGVTICPFCLEELSAMGFYNKMEQAEGREVLDLTITKLNLFHIEELKHGKSNHRPYNLGWGHHHCNVIVKDTGIAQTISWLYDVVQRNILGGYFLPKTKGS